MPRSSIDTGCDVGTSVSVGPLVRVNPRPGVGFAGAFNWYRADLNNPDGGDSPFARPENGEKLIHGEGAWPSMRGLVASEEPGVQSEPFRMTRKADK